jgi:hypothetical protein
MDVLKQTLASAGFTAVAAGTVLLGSGAVANADFGGGCGGCCWGSHHSSNWTHNRNHNRNHNRVKIRVRVRNNNFNDNPGEAREERPPQVVKVERPRPTPTVTKTLITCPPTSPPPSTTATP